MKQIQKLLPLFLAACLLGGCSGSQAADPAPAKAASSQTDPGKLQAIATVFPEYDWAKAVIGDTGRFELSMLLDNGVDMHSYQPTVDDMIRISDCDVFLYIGGESDRWVSDALADPANKDRKAVCMMEELGNSVRVEELVEGMEAGHEHSHTGEDAHDHGDAGDAGHEEAGHEEAGHEAHEHEEDANGHDHAAAEMEYDEHVWLSLRNAEVLVRSIADAFAAADPENAAAYQANADAYIAELTELDSQYLAAVNNAPKNTLLFADRFPFRYLTEDYGLDYYAAFSGCSAETEASFETVIFLADKLDELGLSTILTIEGSDGRLAETVRANTASKNQSIEILNSMQGISSEDIKNGCSYLSVMRDNLGVLTLALQ